MTNKKIIDTENTSNIAESDSRRKFLKKAGLVAIYTPPAVAILMSPSQASIQKSPGGTYDKCDDNDSGYRRH